uniref:RAN binding protein 1, putative n=1 Tax=Theileria annulata TaxID=5874 RepID=A0A3B0MXM3_THEAN
MAETLDSVVNSVTDTAEKMKKDMVDTFKSALEKSDKATENLAEKVKETFTLVSDKTKNFSENFTFDVSQSARKVADSVTESFDKMPEKVIDTFNYVSDGAQDFFDKMKLNVNELLDTSVTVTGTTGGNSTGTTATMGGTKVTSNQTSTTGTMGSTTTVGSSTVTEDTAKGATSTIGTTTNTTTGTVDMKNETSKETEYVEEEEVVEGDWKAPKVEVKEIKVETGEEDEDVFWSQRSKLYRWSTDTDGSGVWKERGLGESKLLRHRETGKIRFLLRQEKTFKVVANHYVWQTNNMCKLTPNVGSDKIWVWTAQNTLEDGNKVEQLALKFPNVEQAQLFKNKFDEAAELNSKLFN